MKPLKEWTIWLINWYCIWFAIFWVISMTPIGRDSTDQSDWGYRSNLVIRTDALTGCEYLATSGGGLTPRIDGKGRQLGCKP